MINNMTFEIKRAAREGSTIAANPTMVEASVKAWGRDRAYVEIESDVSEGSLNGVSVGDKARVVIGKRRYPCKLKVVAMELFVNVESQGGSRTLKLAGMESRMAETFHAMRDWCEKWEAK